MRSLTHLAAALLVGTAVSVGAGAAHAQTVQLTYSQPLSAGGVQMVQERLRQIGGYPGAVDGVWGPDSVTALQRFQQTHGLQPTGELNQATVASLGLDPNALVGAPAVAAAVPPVAPPYEPALSVHAVQMVQGRLRSLGYYHGGIDGVWGPATQNAIASFQQGRGLQPNGELNTATVAALGLNPSYVFATR
jgi:peptidoglycan hydrolase-like protein with peptidoglycan-binding domain